MRKKEKEIVKKKKIKTKRYIIITIGKKETHLQKKLRIRQEIKKIFFLLNFFFSN